MWRKELTGGQDVMERIMDGVKPAPTARAGRERLSRVPSAFILCSTDTESAPPNQQAIMDRLSKLIHHITTLCEPEKLGRTKLAKIIWFSDVERYRKTGETITHSDEYIKDEFGPRHRRLYEAIDALKSEGKLVERSAFTPVGTRREYVPLELPDVDEFSAEEIATVDRITTMICKMSAGETSDLTHDELWKAAYLGERMPVAAAAPIAGEITPEILRWAESVIDADGAAT